MVKRMPLSSIVKLNPQFVRSVRLDTDFGRPDALHGYLPQPGTRTVLENMSRQIVESRQRAFTWTGPYGGGKSSLALVLASLVGQDGKLRKQARQLLKVEATEPLGKAFNPGRVGWLVLPVVGRRVGVETELASTIERLAPKRLGRPTKQKTGVIGDLVRLAESGAYSGVLVVLDELGKFLESAAATGDDIHFYQELAEAASRCDGKLVVVGILHQAFEQYASRLGREAREEWSKVQGRFVDIPVVSGSDEVLSLIGNAIETKGFSHPSSEAVARVIGEAIVSRRAGAPKSTWQRLNGCWPLHPVSAALLGPSAKRRFGQNERSIFGFLNSAEPLGFREYLEGTEARDGSFYWPSQYWDYLRANLEPAILASSDGHRWAQAAEAVERAEARYGPLHVAIVKTIGLIELFRNGTGIVASNEVLSVSANDVGPGEVESALAELSRATIVIYRKHLNGWGVYAGSDFDIESAIRSAKTNDTSSDVSTIAKRTDLLPISAKRVYRETGALRWFTRHIVSAYEAERYVEKYQPREGSSGEFVLVIPERGTSSRAALSRAKALSARAKHPGLVIGCANNGDRIADFSGELAALETVSATRAELEGDSVARREVRARLMGLRSNLDEELRESFLNATWFYEGQSTRSRPHQGISQIASHIAETIYRLAPRFFSELVNRDNLSSNSVKARRDLMYRMMRDSQTENLEYVGYPADAGLYFTILKPTGLHRVVDGAWSFGAPTHEAAGSSLMPLWKATLEKISVANQMMKLSDIYGFWERPPFGVKRGIQPILALSMFLANRNQLALYIDGTFVPDLTEANVDEWLQDPGRIAWRFVQIDVSENAMLIALADALTNRLGRAVMRDALESARALVSLAYALPPWTKRTASVSAKAQSARQLLLKASDPHKVLFNDLPQLLGRSADAGMADEVAGVIQELSDAYPKMLQQIHTLLMESLDHQGTLEVLRQRGETLRGIVGDFKLDAFASRIAQYDGSDSSIEGILSLAVQKPPRDWTDRDIDTGILQLGAWALAFRRDETLAPMRDRPATRRAIAVVFGVGVAGKTVADSFDVGEADLPLIDEIAHSIFSQSQVRGIKREVFLAGLAQAGARIVEESSTGSQDG